MKTKLTKKQKEILKQLVVQEIEALSSLDTDDIVETQVSELEQLQLTLDILFRK